MTAAQIADLAGVSVDQIRQASVEEVMAAHMDTASANVVEVATQEPATYWYDGTAYWLDDPYFGGPVRILDLAYDSELGLHHRDIRGD